LTERVQLGWRVPADVWDRFEDFVYEKHGATGPYLRFELECAMREYLDDDGVLAEAEKLLKESTDLRGLSSSKPVVGTDRYHGADTRKLSHRINAELKERFQIFADKHDASSYGRLLAATLDAYTDGGRARRILEDVERLVTGGTSGGTTGESVENDGDSDETGLSTAEESGTSDGTTAEIRVEPSEVVEIADTIVEDPTNTMIPKQLLDEKIVSIAGVSTADAIDAYREAVLNHLNADDHPHNDRVYTTEAYREEHTLWADLNRDERLVLLRRYAAADAVEHRDRTRCFDYKDVQDLFEHNAGGGGPSHEYAYQLMEDAADEPGFKYDKFHGQLQLRVDLSDVNWSIKKYAFEQNPDAATEEIRRNLDITTYTAGSPPQQEGMADD
jgi:hypothetical protein